MSTPPALHPFKPSPNGGARQSRQEGAPRYARGGPVVCGREKSGAGRARDSTFGTARATRWTAIGSASSVVVEVWSTALTEQQPMQVH
ncbi:MAG TPA: hypothetical protein VH539_06045 [Gemmatimonadaceae bacterium]